MIILDKVEYKIDSFLGMAFLFGYAGTVPEVREIVVESSQVQNPVRAQQTINQTRPTKQEAKVNAKTAMLKSFFPSIPNTSVIA